MKLMIRADEGVGADLYRWLISDPELSLGAAINPVPQAAGGEMGLGFDLLNLIIPNTIALGSLVVSLASFRDSRRQSTGVAPHVSIGHADTITVIDGNGAEALQELLASSESP